MNYYTLHTVLLVIILLFIIAIICYHYAKLWSKQKKYWHTNTIKWAIMNFKICIKYRTCCHFNDMIKFEDFDFGNIVSGKKSNRNILIYELCVICSIK